MIEIKVTGGLERMVSDWSRIASSQIPFATALALTRTAQEAKREVERQLPMAIDRPTPWTMRGFRLWPATKARLRAEVDFRDSFGKGSHARDYLSPQVFGGARKLKAFERSLDRVGLLPSGYAAVPGEAAKIDSYGNMHRGQIVQVLSYMRAFSEQGSKANITDKRKASLARGSKSNRGIAYFVGRPGNGRLPLGIWQRTHFGALGTSIRPLVIFVKSPTYRIRFNVPGIANRVAAQRFEANMAKAWKEAMRTAIPKSQGDLF